MSIQDEVQKELMEQFKIFFEPERCKFLKAETCNDAEDFAKLCFVKGARASIDIMIRRKLILCR